MVWNPDCTMRWSRRGRAARSARAAPTAVVAAALLGAVVPGALAQGLPTGFSEGAKDLWGELQEAAAEGTAAFLSPDACESRLKLLKELAKSSAREAPHLRAMVIKELGLCDLKAEQTANAKKRFISAISEFNVPNEEMLMQNKQVVSYVLVRDAVIAMENNEPTKAATAFRRAKTVYARERQGFHHNFAKQNNIPEEHAEAKLEEMKKGLKGAQGQNTDQLKAMIGNLNKLEAEKELVERVLEKLDTAISIEEDAASKQKATRLKNSLSGPYVPGLASSPVSQVEDLQVAKALIDKVDKIAKEIQAAKPEKHLSLLKRTKEGSGCKTLPDTCAVLSGLTDVQTNGFGESRLLVLKPGKPQALDSCETNANVGILIALDGPVSVTIGGESSTVEKKEGIVVDFCLASSMVAEEPTKVLFAQAWHPQYASLERTTEIRTRAKKWSLSEAEVKDVTKAVNSAAKKEWESALKLWMKGTAVSEANSRFAKKAEAEKIAAEETRKAKEKSDMESDEDRKRGLEELEKKRQAKKQEEEAKERKRKELEQRRRDEEAKKDPWLRDPLVIAAREKLEELKEARRDANAKLEFDLTTQLTKEISAQERTVQKLIKKAKKAHKKGKTLADEEGSSEQASADSSSSGVAVAGSEESKQQESAGDLEKKLAKLSEEIKEAAEKEDFGKASTLKKEKEAVQKKLASLKASSGDGEEVAKLKAELKEVEAAKAKAAADEDFAEAKRLKSKQTELKEKLKKLKVEL